MTSGTIGTQALTAPEPLAPDHELDAFESGVSTLDDWLKRRARRNEAEGASRTFVSCAGRRVVGYYSLAAGSILLGRLAVDRAWHRKGLGADLLSDAVLRAIGAAESVGVRAIMVHAISEEAKTFYEKHGFRPSPVEPMTLMVTIEEAQRMLGRRSR